MFILHVFQCMTESHDECAILHNAKLLLILRDFVWPAVEKGTNHCVSHVLFARLNEISTGMSVKLCQREHIEGELYNVHCTFPSIRRPIKNFLLIERAATIIMPIGYTCTLYFCMYTIYFDSADARHRTNAVFRNHIVSIPNPLLKTKTVRNMVICVFESSIILIVYYP